LTLAEESYILYDIGYSASFDLSSGDFVVKAGQIILSLQYTFRHIFTKEILE